MMAMIWWTFVAACLLPVRIVSGIVRRRAEPRDAIVGRTLAELLQRLGPAFIKVGQLLGSRRDLFSEGIIRQLQSLQDGLPSRRRVIARDVVSRALGVPAEAVFAEFSNTPMATGSIATVHRARLHDGRAVVVKLMSPRVVETIRADLRLLRRVARVAERIPGLGSLPIGAVVEEVGACLLHQSDFTREADANHRLRAALGDGKDVVIPRLVDELCRPTLLTMEYIEAFAEPVVRRGESDRVAIRRGVRALYQMIFIEGLVHCDMHEGNVRCLPDGRLALIDFGFVAAMDTETRLSFAEFFFAMATGDGAWCADIAPQLAA